jgi:hypothetical protein
MNKKIKFLLLDMYGFVVGLGLKGNEPEVGNFGITTSPILPSLTH